MKLINPTLFAILLTFTILSCEDTNEPEEEQIPDFLVELENRTFSEQEGLYVGTSTHQSVQVGSWVTLLYENKLYGVNTGDDELLLNGTEDYPNIMGTGVSPEDPTYVVNFSGILESNTDGEYFMTGTWDNGEVSGEFSGERIEQAPDGGYIGVAYEGEELVARWVLVLYDNDIIGITTGQEDEIILEGGLSGTNISGTGTGSNNGETYTITWIGTLQDGEMTGTWSDDESSGEFEGIRIAFD